MTPSLEDLLGRVVAVGASDLHLSAGAPPTMRLHGQLAPLDGPAKLDEATVDGLAAATLNAGQRAAFERDRAVDLAVSLRSGERFRVNVFRERGRTALAIRRLDDRFRTLAELGLPEDLGALADLRDGLVLVTGPVGSGKTTTLATLVHRINQSRACHILTIEDPVEYLHANARSLVRQRELHTDVPSFHDAVRSSLREDPDVLLVGEMRDLETMRAAIVAAETGHLVFSTLHSGDAVGAIDRMVGVFPSEEQASVRQQLSMTLRAVVAQRLLPRADGRGRAPAVELLVVTPAVAHLVRSGKPQQVYSAMETGAEAGMRTLEQSLARLAAQGLVRVEVARRLARDARTFDERLRLEREVAAAGPAAAPSARALARGGA